MIIEEKILQICKEQVEMFVNVKTINIDSYLNDDLGLDSLDRIEILMAIERELNVDMDDEKCEKFKTIKDVVEYVKTLVK